ncbi:MAG: DoxX family protein [Candidatus Omnitrophica bacterium]|nr:DoxX family protein [Candidatus Omnitrophota bacterium]MDD5042585.1 DoxX family protein [Candidatus Omnitrophota bacterium]MDD5501087.1 DoxX family protein [Candidatus Omnitrophota bacterium]
MADLGILVLRLGLGVMFAAHGLQKAFGLFGGPGIKGFSASLSSLGFAPAVFWACLAAYTELIGGLFLIIGLKSRLVSAALLILISVAGLKVHLKNGFFLSQGGFEYTFVIAVSCLALIFLGPGRFSVLK